MKQPQGLASTLAQFMSIVHISPGFRGIALAFATHCSAWQGTDGAQSASVLQASSLMAGSHRLHPQSFALGDAAGAVDEAAGGAGSAGATLATGGELAAGIVIVVVAGGGGGGGGEPAHAAKVKAAATPREKQARIVSDILSGGCARPRHERRACAQ